MLAIAGWGPTLLSVKVVASGKCAESGREDDTGAERGLQSDRPVSFLLSWAGPPDDSKVMSQNRLQNEPLYWWKMRGRAAGRRA